jgi:hypothetical protein
MLKKKKKKKEKKISANGDSNLRPLGKKSETKNPSRTNVITVNMTRRMTTLVITSSTIVTKNTVHLRQVMNELVNVGGPAGSDDIRHRDIPL